MTWYEESVAEVNLNVPQFAGDIYYVDAAQADDTGSGLSPDTAKKTIQAAIDATSAGDAVTVKAGSYTEDVDMNKNYLELWPEIGTQITAASGVALTLSANFCKVWCPGGISKITPVANGTGVLITGLSCYVSDIRVFCGSSADIGIYIGSTADNTDGNGSALINCGVSAPLIAAFKIQADKIKLTNCDTNGEIADVSIGYWLLADGSGSADRIRLKDCGSQSHATSGYQIDTGVTNAGVDSCYSGGGDGKWTDADNSCVWSNFAYDDELYKSLTLDANNTTKSYNLYRVYGIVKIMNIYAHVETVLSANHTDCFIDVYDGASVPLSKDTTLTLSAAPVGSMIVRNADATNILSYHSGANAFISENSSYRDPTTEVIVGAKGNGTATYIRFTHTTTDAPSTGLLHFHVEWVPLSNMGFLVEQ